jgi:L-2-hydroxyglutarate oxidase LhgO
MDAEIVIIGAGAVGLAIASKIAGEGHSVILLEKEANYGLGISSRSSEVIHAGIYYQTGSLKASLCLRGKRLLYEHCKKYNIRHKRLGKLFIAVTEKEISRLHIIKEQAVKNGIDDLIEMNEKDIKRIEPEIYAIAALFSPSSGIFDSHGFMKSLFTLGKSRGMVFVPNSPFIDGEPTSVGWRVKVGGYDPVSITCRVVINSAGLYAVEISKSIFSTRVIPKLHPTKGSYVRYSGNLSVRHIIYPALVPGLIEERVDATPDLEGRPRFGPNIEDVRNLEDFSLSHSLVDSMYGGIKRYLPNLEVSRLHPDCAGIRPKIYDTKDAVEDFRFDWAPERGWLDLWGIESPGLTASLAIAEHVYSLIKEKRLL